MTSSIMHKFSLSLLLNILQTILLYVNGEASNEDPQKYLPFVLMSQNGKLLYPEVMSQGTYDDGLGFKGDVRFSSSNIKEQIFLCPPENAKDEEKIDLANSLYNLSPKIKKMFGNADVGQNCLLQKSFGIDENLKCLKEAAPIIYEEFDENDETKFTSCGPQNKSKMYKFVYDICPKVNFVERAKQLLPNIRSKKMRTFFQQIPFWHKTKTVYEICFDLDNKNTVYTKHQLSSIPLLFDDRLEQERKKNFDISTLNYKYFSDLFIQQEKFYNQLEKSQEPGAPDDENSNSNTLVKYKPQFLVPPGDMPTALLRKPTFHYINVKLMPEILIGLWNHIENCIREALKESNLLYDVYTGAFSLSTEQQYPQIPNLWIKIVYFDYNSTYRSNIGIAFLLKNETPESGKISLLDYCQLDLCDYMKRKDDLYVKFSHVVDNFRCCTLHKGIQNLFGLNLRNDVALKIPGLTTPKKVQQA